MRQEPHPISGALYCEQGDGTVRVDDKARDSWGIFRLDGSWVEGPLTHADPQLLLYVAGPALPPGRDVYWGMTPPYEEAETEQVDSRSDAPGVTPGRRAGGEKIVARYTGDPGLATPEGIRSASYLDQDFYLQNDRRPDLIPDVFRLKSPMPGGPMRVNTIASSATNITNVRSSESGSERGRWLAARMISRTSATTSSTTSRTCLF